jgi:PIN domain nuclease of toxin-antitoxin system
LRLLLDTYVWLWMVARPDRLGADARAALEDHESTLFLSAASVWEMAIKYALGKLALPEPPALFVPPRLSRDGVLPLPVELRHAAAVAQTPLHHRDPFDRLIVAQAEAEDLILCTADAALTAYGVPVLLAA